jgi:CHAD domain-containing protein
MKKNQCFRNYTRSLNKKIQKKIVASKDTGKADDIHGVRVNIKKLKAYAELLEFLNPDFSAGKLKDILKKVFKSAGKIRDLQVQLKMLDKFEKQIGHRLTDERKLMIKNQEKLLKKFKDESKQIDKSTFHKIEKRLDDACKKKISPVSIKLFLVNQLIETEPMMNKKSITPRRLHRFRICLKSYYYNATFANQCSLKDPEVTRHIASLDQFQEVLGKWHDHISFHLFANKLLEKVSAKEKAIVHLLIEKVKQQTVTSSKKIMKRIPEILKSFDSMKQRLVAV